MSRAFLAAASVALTVALGTAGCAQAPPNPYATATAADLQQSVLHVTQAAGEGDFGAARIRLDELEVSTKVAHARGELTEARHDSVLAAIALVRADLERLAAEAEATAAAEKARAEEEARKAAEAEAAAQREAAQREAAEAERRVAAERDAEADSRSAHEDDDDDDDDKGEGKGKGKGKGENKGKGKGKDD